MVDILSFWARQHSHGVAAIIFIEAAGGSHGSSSHDGGWVHTPPHHRVFIVITTAELVRKLERSTAKENMKYYHDGCRVGVGTKW